VGGTVDLEAVRQAWALKILGVQDRAGGITTKQALEDVRKRTKDLYKRRMAEKKEPDAKKVMQAFDIIKASFEKNKSGGEAKKASASGSGSRPSSSGAPAAGVKRSSSSASLSAASGAAKAAKVPNGQQAKANGSATVLQKSATKDSERFSRLCSSAAADASAAKQSSAQRLLQRSGSALVCSCGQTCHLMEPPKTAGSFSCPTCRVRAMDPLNVVVHGRKGLLKLVPMEKYVVKNSWQNSFFKLKFNLPDLQAWRKAGHNVELRMCTLDTCDPLQKWPATLICQVNGRKVFEIKPAAAGHKRRDIPKRISAELKSGPNVMEVKMSDVYVKRFVLALLRTVPQTVKQLLTKVAVPGEDDCKSRVSQIIFSSLLESTGEDVHANSHSDQCSLHCPITLTRLELPTRGHKCWHLQCFDLKAYLTSNSKMAAFNRRWRCPVCDIELKPPKDLFVDTYLLQILGKTEADDEEIKFDSSAEWHVTKKTAPPGDPSSDEEEVTMTYKAPTVVAGSASGQAPAGSPSGTSTAEVEDVDEVEAVDEAPPADAGGDDAGGDDAGGDDTGGDAVIEMEVEGDDAGEGEGEGDGIFGSGVFLEGAASPPFDGADGEGEIFDGDASPLADASPIADFGATPAADSMDELGVSPPEMSPLADSAVENADDPDGGGSGGDAPGSAGPAAGSAEPASGSSELAAGDAAGVADERPDKGSAAAAAVARLLAAFAEADDDDDFEDDGQGFQAAGDAGESSDTPTEQFGEEDVYVTGGTPGEEEGEEAAETAVEKAAEVEEVPAQASSAQNGAGAAPAASKATLQETPDAAKVVQESFWGAAKGKAPAEEVPKEKAVAKEKVLAKEVHKETVPAKETPNATEPVKELPTEKAAAKEQVLAKEVPKAMVTTKETLKAKEPAKELPTEKAAAKEKVLAKEVPNEKVLVKETPKGKEPAKELPTGKAAAKEKDSSKEKKSSKGKKSLKENAPALEVSKQKAVSKEQEPAKDVSQEKVAPKEKAPAKEAREKAVSKETNRAKEVPKEKVACKEKESAKEVSKEQEMPSKEAVGQLPTGRRLGSKDERAGSRGKPDAAQVQAANSKLDELRARLASKLVNQAMSVTSVASTLATAQSAKGSKVVAVPSAGKAAPAAAAAAALVHVVAAALAASAAPAASAALAGAAVAAAAAAAAVPQDAAAEPKRKRRRKHSHSAAVSGEAPPPPPPASTPVPPVAPSAKKGMAFSSGKKAASVEVIASDDGSDSYSRSRSCSRGGARHGGGRAGGGRSPSRSRSRSRSARRGVGRRHGGDGGGRRRRSRSGKRGKRGRR